VSIFTDKARENDPILARPAKEEIKVGMHLSIKDIPLRQ
jgi:hypothetical protein